MEALEKEQQGIREDQRAMKESLEIITATLTELSVAVKTKSESHSGGGGSNNDDGNKSEEGSDTGEKPDQGKNKGGLQLPSFDGMDPIGWLARANQQFEITGTATESRVAAAVVAMEGPALYWMTWLHSRKPSLTWKEFSEALVSRFDTRFQGDAFERLADIKQIKGVEDYVNLFVQLSSQVPGLTDAHYLGYFMKGLKDPIRGFLRLFRPTELESAMELARDVEDNLAIQGGGRTSLNWNNSTPRRSGWSRSGSMAWTDSIGRPSQNFTSSNSRPGEKSSMSRASEAMQHPQRPRFTRISSQELAELKAKGLCFRCRKPYSPGHECSLKQLRVMITEGEKIDLQQYEFYQPTGLEEMYEEHEESGEGDVELPLYSMAGIDTARTMRLHAKLGEHTIIVLIDSGASHNFISRALVDRLQLQPDREERFGVLLGNGLRQEAEGACRKIEVTLAGCQFLLDCFVFPLGGVDMILGMTWLSTLGEVKHYYDKMIMKFEKEGRCIKLRGDPQLCRGPIGLKSLINSRDAQVWAIVLEEKGDAEIHEQEGVQEVLQQFHEVFGDPKSLPPERVTDHRITLEDALSKAEWLGFEGIESEQRSDEYLKAIIESIQRQPDSRPGFRLVGTKLFFHDRITLPAASRWIPELLHEFHDTPSGGHAGVLRTYRRIATNVYWKELPVLPMLEPEQILALRVIPMGKREVEQLLVKWKGEGEDGATWIDLQHFMGQFPDFDLEDKVDSKGDGIDMKRKGDNQGKPLIVTATFAVLLLPRCSVAASPPARLRDQPPLPTVSVTLRLRCCDAPFAAAAALLPLRAELPS
ncbi:hypothetical protein SASPL_141538 [Salvia splendens]|uniref:Retrotransposon gag domain-containing protein n=1 Tax=Salvia splendens TaxID=180675 RepID=A0A8X8WQQ7_SALSN|nr:hypothetical protein SASPL_141538 [Salvia splendens]